MLDKPEHLATESEKQAISDLRTAAHKDLQAVTEKIAAFKETLLHHSGDLSGMSTLVTAGMRHEDLQGQELTRSLHTCVSMSCPCNSCLH